MDLETATIDQLIDELHKRFSVGLIVIGVRQAPGDESREDFFLDDRACVTLGIGMAKRALDCLLRDSFEGERTSLSEDP